MRTQCLFPGLFLNLLYAEAPNIFLFIYVKYTYNFNLNEHKSRPRQVHCHLGVRGKEVKSRMGQPLVAEVAISSHRQLQNPGEKRK